MCELHSVPRMEKHVRHTLTLWHLQAQGSCLSTRWSNCAIRASFLRSHTLSDESDTAVVGVNTSYQQLKLTAVSTGHQGISEIIWTLASQPSYEGNIQRVKGPEIIEQECHRRLSRLPWGVLEMAKWCSSFQYLKNFTHTFLWGHWGHSEKSHPWRHNFGNHHHISGSLYYEPMRTLVKQ